MSEEQQFLIVAQDQQLNVVSPQIGTRVEQHAVPAVKMIKQTALIIVEVYEQFAFSSPA
ncbi:MAG TPA: hypothetical protein VJY62_14195 [Bacteroidia bacterium]|nr:hypothetical protein [Bacteroidia bacterium]